MKLKVVERSNRLVGIYDEIALYYYTFVRLTFISVRKSFILIANDSFSTIIEKRVKKEENTIIVEKFSIKNKQKGFIAEKYSRYTVL